MREGKNEKEPEIGGFADDSFLSSVENGSSLPRPFVSNAFMPSLLGAAAALCQLSVALSPSLGTGCSFSVPVFVLSQSFAPAKP